MDVILRTSRLIFTLKAQYKNIMPFLRGKWTNADNQWTFEGQNQFHMIWDKGAQKGFFAKMLAFGDACSL